MKPATAVLFALLWLLPAHSAGAAGAAPRVVASLLPVHSLAASVMAGVGAPRLLIRGGSSPHAFALKPSGARMLQEADAVFWIGPGLESFLAKPLRSLSRRARVVALWRAKGVTLLPVRAGGLWEGDGAETRASAGAAGPYAVNPHIWLSPVNAQAMGRAIARTLAGADPANAARYRANAEGLAGRIGALDRELRARLRPVAGKPYLVFHDAYRYFEDRYGLNAVGAITVSPDRRPGPRRLRRIRRKIQRTKALCVFREPQFAPRLVGVLTASTSARTGVLDPLGADLSPGPAAYFRLMRAMARALTDCLAGRKSP